MNTLAKLGGKNIWVINLGNIFMFMIGKFKKLLKKINKFINSIFILFVLMCFIFVQGDRLSFFIFLV